MNIMPAGVHYAGIQRAKRHAGRLFDRQRIDIGTQGYHLIAAAHFGNRAGFQFIRQQADAAALQPVANTCGGVDLLQRELRVLVQFAPPAN